MADDRSSEKAREIEVYIKMNGSKNEKWIWIWYLGFLLFIFWAIRVLNLKSSLGVLVSIFYKENYLNRYLILIPRFVSMNVLLELIVCACNYDAYSMCWGVSDEFYGVFGGDDFWSEGIVGCL